MNEKPEVKMVEKPVPRKLRGTATFFDGDDFEFRAQRSTGVSTQSVVKSEGKSKIYNTIGEKKNTMVAHLVVNQDDPDPASTMMEQLERLTRDMNPKKKPALRGKTLLDDPDCRVIFSKKESKVDIRMSIDIKATPNYNQSLMNLMYKLNQCFAINQTSLASAR